MCSKNAKLDLTIPVNLWFNYLYAPEKAKFCAHRGTQQRESLDKIQVSCASVGIKFSWEFDTTGAIHARHITTDHGWKILLDRGIDVFQQYDMNDTFAFSNRLQQYRQCKAFEVTFIRLG